MVVFAKKVVVMSIAFHFTYIYINGMIHCLSYMNLFQFICFVSFILRYIYTYVMIHMHNLKIESFT